jgi:hypothetical protein
MPRMAAEPVPVFDQRLRTIIADLLPKLVPTGLRDPRPWPVPA